MEVKFIIKELINHYAKGFEKEDQKRLDNLRKLENEIKAKNVIQNTANLVYISLEKSVVSRIEKSLEYFKNNPAEKYPTDEEYQSYMLGCMTGSKTESSKPIESNNSNNAEEESTKKPLENTISENQSSNTKLENLQESDKQQNNNTVGNYNLTLNEVFKIIEKLTSVDYQVNLLNKTNNDYFNKLNYKVEALNTRIDKLDNLERNVLSLKESLNNTQLLLAKSTNEIIDSIKTSNTYIKELPENLTTAIHKELDILNNSDVVKLVQEFGTMLNDELKKIDKKHREMADTIAIEVMNEAAKNIKKVNSEFVETSVQKNKNLLVYGLIASFVFSIVTGAFVGKLVGNSTGTATIDYLQTKFDQAAQKQQQNEIQQLKAQLNKKQH